MRPTKLNPAKFYSWAQSKSTKGDEKIPSRYVTHISMFDDTVHLAKKKREEELNMKYTQKPTKLWIHTQMAWKIRWNKHSQIGKGEGVFAHILQEF